jgi:hypothetical protein
MPPLDDPMARKAQAAGALPATIQTAMKWKDLKKELLLHAEFAKEYAALQGEYQRTRQLLDVAMRDRQLAFFRRLSQHCDLEVLASNEMWR